MRFGKLIIALLTLFLAALSVLVMTQEERTVSYRIPLTFSVQAQGHTESLSCWENPEGDYIVFIPGYAGMEQVVAHGEDNLFLLDGKPVPAHMVCSHFKIDKAYSVMFEDGEDTREQTLTFVQCGNAASLYIDVASGSMDYIHMNKSNQESGSLRLYDQEGYLLQKATIAEMKGRGETSWTASKKPYSFTLAQEADLLQMGSARKWVLLSDGLNPVNIRNKIVYDFARGIGMPYTPDSEWVSLYLNGSYAGLYLLTERNEIHDQRIDIPVEGSFLISMEDRQYLEEQKIPYLDMESEQVIRIRQAGLDQQEIMEVWQSLKNALLAEDGRDPVSGICWQDKIDLDSWVRKYLIEEIFANPDGGVTSQFFYLNGSDPQGIIHAGPVWDYDYAMGGENHWMRFYTSYLIMDRDIDSIYYLPWFYEMYHRDMFYQRLTELYEEEFLPKLTDLVENRIDGYIEQMYSAMLSDGIRWDCSEDEIGSDLYFIKKFMDRRIEFLTDLWIKGTAYHIVRVCPDRYESGYFAVKDGEYLPDELIEDDWGGLGWYDAETGEPFDVSQPIYQDVRICLKKQEELSLSQLAPGAALVALLAVLILLDRSRNKKMRMQK